jgi:hypothetical protein
MAATIQSPSYGRYTSPGNLAMPESCSSFNVVALYSLYIPGLWDAINCDSIQPDILLHNNIENRNNLHDGKQVFKELLDAARKADEAYQHPRKQNNILRFCVLEDDITSTKYNTELPICVLIHVSSDDLAVFSVFVLALEFSIELVLKVLEDSRPWPGRYRSNEFELSVNPGEDRGNNIYICFKTAVNTIMKQLCIQINDSTVVDYYPYIIINDTDSRYTKCSRDLLTESELVAILTGEKKHIGSLEPGWAEIHLGKDLAHTASREFYVSAVGTVYIIDNKEKEPPSVKDLHSTLLKGIVINRALSSLTFLEMFRSQVVLIRYLEDSVEDVFNRKIKASTPGDVVNLYLKTVRALARYENRVVQTTAWRRFAWNNIRDRFLADRFSALCFKLDRLEVVLEVFDRMRVQTFLISLSAFLGLLTLIPSDSWSPFEKVGFLAICSSTFILIIWKIHDIWWRRRLFSSRKIRRRYKFNLVHRGYGNDL